MRPVLSILTAIEKELIALQQWSDQRPSEQALASTQPFCIDTLTLPQWIQFVLIERLRHMIDTQLPLPRQCGVAPLAEEFFKPTSLDSDRLIELLEQLDNQLTRA